MSRSNTTKSRAERSTLKVAATAATPVTHDIIPGKLTDHDWTSLVERDDAVDFIADLLEEWYAGVDKIIFDNYIERQLVPYTILQAKDAILQIMEWQFLSRDDGKPVDDATGGWIPDTEPETAVMDCWAQGAVPKIVSSRVASSYTPLTAASLGDLTDDQSQSSHPPSGEQRHYADNAVDEAGVSVAESSVSLGQSSTPETEKGDAIDEREAAAENGEDERHAHSDDSYDIPEPVNSSVKSPLITTENSRLRKQRPVAKTTLNNGGDLSSTSLQLEKSEVVLKPIKSVSAADNVIKKINPHKLPTNVVNTMFSIVDPSVQEAEERRKLTRNGRRSLQGTSKKTADMSFGQATILTSGENFVEIASTFHPMLIDTMDLAAGVVIRDERRVKKGPKQRTVAETELLCTALRRGLQPVRLQHQTQPSLSASDLLGSHVPVIRPLVETVPIPPINQMAST